MNVHSLCAFRLFSTGENKTGIYKNGSYALQQACLLFPFFPSFGKGRGQFFASKEVKTDFNMTGTLKSVLGCFFPFFLSDFSLFQPLSL